MDKIGNIFKRKEILLLILVLLLATYLRLYRISDYMTFLGDEGRDVLERKHTNVLNGLKAGQYTDEITNTLEEVAKEVSKKFRM